MKYLYIVDFWVPFPGSEYGGQILAIAESREELKTLLNEAHEYSVKDFPEEFSNAVRAAECYALDPSEDYESSVVRDFIT